MDAFLTVTLMTLIAGVGGTGLGGILGALVRTESNRIVSLLLSATSGVMVSIVCFELMVESQSFQMGQSLSYALRSLWAWRWYSS